MPTPTHDTSPDRVQDADPAAGHVDTQQDLQRAALQELVDLSAECATTEATIERTHRKSLEQVEAERARANADIEERRQARLREIEATYQEFLAKTASVHDSDKRTLETAQKTARQNLDQENANLEREVKQKYTHASWLAETLLEGVQAQVREESKKAREQYAERQQELQSLEEHAAGWMSFYGQPWPAPEEVSSDGDEAAAEAESLATDLGLTAGAQDLSDESAVENGMSEDSPHVPPVPSAEPPDQELLAPFDELREKTETDLAVLADLRLPRLFTGVLPLVICLGVMAAAGVLAQVSTGSTTPHWNVIGIAAGAALMVVIVVGFVVRAVAVKRVREAGGQLRESLNRTRRAFVQEYRAGVQDRRIRLEAAVRRRDSEVKAAKGRFAPILGKAARDREALLESLRQDRERIVPRIEERRQQSLQEAEDWRSANLKDLEDTRERETAAVRARYDAEVARIEARYRDEWDALRKRWREGLERIQAPIDQRSGANGRLLVDWDAPAWQTWTPPRTFSSSARFGEFKVDLKQITQQLPKALALPEKFSVPALLAFPKAASLLVTSSDGPGRAQAIRTLQTVMVRLLTSLPPGRVRFTILDPVGLGQNFAGFMHLADHDEALVGSRIWTDGEHIERRLADLTEHMETVIQKYLRNEFDTIDEYNAQAGELAEPYRFLVIADLPVHFSDEAIRRLNSIAASGARCGVYTLVARDLRQPLPSGTNLEEVEAHSAQLVQKDGQFIWKDEVFHRFPLTLDGPPSEAFLTRTMHLVGKEAREAKRVEVPFETITPPLDKMWSMSTAGSLEVPIGRMGATRLQTLRLGHGVAQHALIAGKTGSGKSTLLHVLITNLSLWYSPDEVEFYLVDFKKGVEFKAYATHALPHARAVAVESDREFGLSVLQRVDGELTRRGALFRQLGVQDLASYREASGKRMPRTLLIIDEFQEFFSEDDRLAQDAALLLDRLVRQGRAFGIHVLLGSQTIGGTSGLGRSTIGQMAVRIALQTSEADSQVILGDGNSAARLLSRPGEAIYNDMSGLVEANSPFQVAWVSDERRDEHLAQISERIRSEGWPGSEAVVFEGNVPADIRKNRELAALLEQPSWGETPLAPRAWLGEPVAIKEPTAVVLRRQSGSNLLIVGQQEEAAMAVLAAGMLSLAAQHSPRAARFLVLDGSPVDSPLAKVLPRMAEVLPQEVKLTEYRAVEAALGELYEELQRRQSGDEAHPPAVFVVIYGLQRYRALRRQEDSFSFSPREEGAKPALDRQFAELLRDGPPLGIHVLAWCDTPAAVERTLERSSLREFDYRVLFQMSASDSSNLIDSPLANKLGQNRALAYSEEQGTLEKFRPYALPGGEWIDQVREWLASRGQS